MQNFWLTRLCNQNRPLVSKPPIFVTCLDYDHHTPNRPLPDALRSRLIARASEYPNQRPYALTYVQLLGNPLKGMAGQS